METGLVDSKTNNVICIVTCALHLSNEKDEFIKKIKTKKEGLSKVLLKHLGTNVPVAFIENHDKNLEQMNDWTLLPGNEH